MNFYMLKRKKADLRKLIKVLSDEKIEHGSYGYIFCVNKEGLQKIKQAGIAVEEVQVRDIGELPLEERNRIKEESLARMAKKKKRAIADLRKQYGSKKRRKKMKENEVLAMVKEGRVFDLMPSDFEGRPMTHTEVVAILTHFEAFWQYEGEPGAARPHALLKSGLHSNGFIMCKAVLEYPRLCMLLAHEMLKTIELEMTTEKISQIDCVASSAYSAISVGWCLAWLLSGKYNKKAKHVIVEKDDKGNPTAIRGGLDPSLTVLVINELMTTGTGSTWETKRAVLNCNGNNPPPKIIEPAFVLVHRSKDLVLVDGSAVQPVFHFDIENFNPEECPHCKAGSQAIKPKIGDNWQKLHRIPV